MASPTFVEPKKDNSRIRIVSDIRKANTLTKRKSYPMPMIHKIVLKRSGYTRFTMIYFSMQLYCFELEEKNKKYITTITAYGQLFKYNRLHMGIKISPDGVHAIMEEVLQGLDVTCYIDVLGSYNCVCHHVLIVTVFPVLKLRTFLQKKSHFIFSISFATGHFH